MKIAVACEGENVSGHFGHCAEFRIFTVENKEITGSELAVNPGHKKGFLPNFLNDKGVEVIIAGGMGQGAREIFNDKKIEIITGASGNAEKAVKEYIAGSLTTNDEVCGKHEHHHECNNECHKE